MGETLRFLVAAIALAVGAGATIADALPPSSLVATASSLGQRALNDPAAFNFMESLTTEIGQCKFGAHAFDIFNVSEWLFYRTTRECAWCRWYGSNWLPPTQSYRTASLRPP